MPNRTQDTSHRAFLWIALVASLGITALTLSQCRMVQDTVTGVSLAPGRLSASRSCVKHCNDAFEAGIRGEEARHQAANAQCGGDHGCRDAEARVHAANGDRLQDGRKKCKKDCYNEGGGEGHGDP